MRTQCEACWQRQRRSQSASVILKQLSLWHWHCTAAVEYLSLQIFRIDRGAGSKQKLHNAHVPVAAWDGAQT